MRQRVSRRLLALVAVVLALVGTTACSCQTLVERLTGRTLAPQPTAAVASIPTPLPTPDASLATDEFGVPLDSGVEFTLILTEQQASELLLGETLSQDGLSVEDMQVELKPEQVAVTFRASQAESGLSAVITVRGQLLAYDGQAYLRVEDFELDPSTSGLVRMVAKTAISKALEEASTEYGIPIPNDRFSVEEIQQQEAQITIRGRTY